MRVPDEQSRKDHRQRGGECRRKMGTCDFPMSPPLGHNREGIDGDGAITQKVSFSMTILGRPDVSVGAILADGVIA